MLTVFSLSDRGEVGEVRVVLPQSVLLASSQPRSDTGPSQHPGIVTIPKVSRDSRHDKDRLDHGDFRHDEDCH